MSFLAILEGLSFDFSKFEQLSSPKFTKIQSLGSRKLPKMTFLDCLNSSKFDFTLNLSGGKMKNDQILKKPSLNFTFRKFLEHSASLFIMFATSGTNC